MARKLSGARGAGRVHGSPDGSFEVIGIQVPAGTTARLRKACGATARTPELLLGGIAAALGNADNTRDPRTFNIRSQHTLETASGRIGLEDLQE